jgi:hypothetical protein
MVVHLHAFTSRNENAGISGLGMSIAVNVAFTDLTLS